MEITKRKYPYTTFHPYELLWDIKEFPSNISLLTYQKRPADDKGCLRPGG